MARSTVHFDVEERPASVPIWREALFGLDWLALRTSPVLYGCGIPRGDGAPVVVAFGRVNDQQHFAYSTLLGLGIGFAVWLRMYCIEARQ